MRMACGVRRATCETVAVHFIVQENAFDSATAATRSSDAHAARRMPHIRRDNGEVSL
jgi:hypothetical protein